MIKNLKINEVYSLAIFSEINANLCISYGNQQKRLLEYIDLNPEDDFTTLVKV